MDDLAALRSEITRAIGTGAPAGKPAAKLAAPTSGGSSGGVTRASEAVASSGVPVAPKADLLARARPPAAAPPASTSGSAPPPPAPGGSGSVGGGSGGAGDDRLVSTAGSAADFAREYDLGRVLGSGSFSRVVEATARATGQRVAVKVIAKTKDLNMRALRSEVEILSSLKHPHVVHLYGVFEDADNVYLVMELMLGGELFDRLVTVHPRGYSERECSQLVATICEAVKYLHARNIIHRDLKPENLLLATTAPDSPVKISDFGLATSKFTVRTACGSPNYIAPEILKNAQEGSQGTYTRAVDMWSIGVITYVLLCGFAPFSSKKLQTLFRLIVSGKFSFPSPYWDAISPAAKDFISRLIVVDPAARMTAEQAVGHPFLANAAALSGAAIPNIVKQWTDFETDRSFRVSAVSGGEPLSPAAGAAASPSAGR